MVTGGAGFIGSHLVEALVEAGAHVSVIDDLRTGKEVNLTGMDGEIDIINGSVEDVCAQSEYPWDRLDFIFDLAAESYVPPSLDDPFSDLRNNVETTLSVLEMARRRYPSAVLIHTSSAAVYGEPTKLPITERHSLIPISPYGVSKLAAEQYVSMYVRVYGLRAAILRLFSVFGPRQQKQVVYDFFRKLAVDSEKLEIIGDGTQTRDLTYVKDVVHAMLIVACSSDLVGDIYNVASGRTITVRELALKISNLMGASSRLEFSGERRAGDPDQWAVDISKLAALGFRPAYPLGSGLETVKEWFVSTHRGAHFVAQA